MAKRAPSLSPSLKLTEKGQQRLQKFREKLPDFGFGPTQVNAIITETRSLLLSGVPANELYIFFLAGKLHIKHADNDIVYVPFLSRQNAGMNAPAPPPPPAGGAGAGAGAGAGGLILGLGEKIGKALLNIHWGDAFSWAGGILDKLKEAWDCDLHRNTYGYDRTPGFLKKDLPGIIAYSGISGKNAGIDEINYYSWLIWGYWFKYAILFKLYGHENQCYKKGLTIGKNATRDFANKVKQELDEHLAEQGVYLTERAHGQGWKAYPSVDLCSFANGQGWDVKCWAKDIYDHYIGYLNPNSGELEGGGGSGGVLDDQSLYGLDGVSVGGTFEAPFYEANLDFTFDGGFLKNIDVDAIVDHTVAQVLDKKIDKGGNPQHSINDILRKKNKQARGSIVAYKSGAKPKTAGGGWLVGTALVLGSLGYMLYGKKAKKQVAKKAPKKPKNTPKPITL